MTLSKTLPQTPAFLAPNAGKYLSALGGVTRVTLMSCAADICDG